MLLRLRSLDHQPNRRRSVGTWCRRAGRGGHLLTNPSPTLSALMSGNYIGILFWACMRPSKNIGSDTTNADTADAVSQVVSSIWPLRHHGVYTKTVWPSLPSTASSSPGGYHALHGVHRFPLYHFPLSALQPVSAGVPLPGRSPGLTAFFICANILNMALCEKLGPSKGIWACLHPLALPCHGMVRLSPSPSATLAAPRWGPCPAIVLSAMSVFSLVAGGAAHPHGLLLFGISKMACRWLRYHRRDPGFCGDCAESAGERATTSIISGSSRGAPATSASTVSPSHFHGNLKARGYCT